MHDAEQLVLKLCMNSFYGVLGASRGYLRCKPAAAAVTATGRNMILATSKFVQERYGAEVIYGDTDSVFIKLPNHTHLSFPDLFTLGPEIAEATSSLFPDPVQLMFEKVMSYTHSGCSSACSGLSAHVV